MLIEKMFESLDKIITFLLKLAFPAYIVFYLIKEIIKKIYGHYKKKKR